jgi:hypothetical protein
VDCVIQHRTWYLSGIIVVLLMLSGMGSAQAGTLATNLQQGVDWLGDQVQSSGTVNGEGASIATPFQVRSETLQTLAELATTPSALTNAVTTNTDVNIEYTARRIIAASTTNGSVSADVITLLANQNDDGGWGAVSGYQSESQDTAFALQALAAANTNAPTSVANGLAYLAQAGSASMGWGINGQSSVYVTANVLLASAKWSSLDKANIQAAATSWLLAARNGTGVFGNTLDNAYGLLALSTQSTQNQNLLPLLNALDTTQLSDGSWADDPYLTALALHAVWYATQPLTTPTMGSVQGIVIDKATGQPLSGSTVLLLQNSRITVTTAGDGSFTLKNIPPASYTLQASLPGYQTQTVSVQIVAGQTANIGTIALIPAPTTATLTGVVKDNSGQALQNVVIAIGTNSTLTDANGAYKLTNIAPTPTTVTASLSGYQTASANVTFTAGGNYLFSPTLYPTNVTPPSGTSLQGTVVDAVTKQAIAGASIVMNGLTQTTDGSGKFVFASATPGAFSLTVSANGYQAAPVSGTLVTGINDVGAIALQPQPTATTLQGKVLDNSGHPVAGATVAISGGPTAISGSDGSYQLTGLTGTHFDVNVSASGYITQAFAFDIPSPGFYTQDFQLLAQNASALTLGALTVAPASAGANTVISVSTTLVNGGSSEFDGVLLLEVYDAKNNIIGRGSLTDTAGFPLGEVMLHPGDSQGIVGHWNSGLFAAGDYQFELRLVQPGSIQHATPLGTLVMDQFAPFSITPTLHFTGTTAGDPPAIQAGINQSVHLTATIHNNGNTPIPAQDMTLNVTDSAGTTAFSARTALSADLPVNHTTTLDFGNWLPTTGGNYLLSATTSDTTIGKASGTEYVGNMAQAIFSVTPDTVLAGTRIVHGKIHITGVNPAQATITDPLAPLVQASTQAAITYNDTAATSWINSNRCSSCHIGNQALIGGELTRKLTGFDPFKRNTILNNVSTNQAADGGLTEGYYGSYKHRLGSLSLWGMLSYHNLQEFTPLLKHAADWVVNFQSTNGDWPSDYNNAWFNNDISMAMLNISNLTRVDTFFKQNAITSIPTYSSQPLLTKQPRSSGGSLTESSTGDLYYTDQSDSSVDLITPDGTLITKWTGFYNPRSVIERADGQVWLSSSSGTFQLNPDGTSTRLNINSFDSLAVGPDGTTVWGYIWGDKTIYRLDATGKPSAWLSNGPFYEISRIVPANDGSLYVLDYYNGNIYHVLPNKAVSIAVSVFQGAGSPPHMVDLFKDGNHWLLSTTNGIYRFSSVWEGQRITWSPAGQLVRLSDGRVIYVVKGKPGIQQLVPQTENVTSSLQKYERAISAGTTWLQAQSIGKTDNLHLAQQLWGLGEAYDFYQTKDPIRAASIWSTMTSLATQLRANQNSDGGWGRSSGNDSDALVTAQVGIALDYTNPSATDPAIRKALTWLLSQQQPDGSWASANHIMSTHVSTTTMVAIWLPTILNRLGSIDAQLSVTLPSNITAANISPVPNQSTTDASGNVTSTWQFTGVTNQGRDLDLDLTLKNMAMNEVRPVASDAHLTFNNSFNQKSVSMPIAVPNVTAQAPVTLGVVTDQPAYRANAVAQVTTTLVNRDSTTIDGTLVVNVLDANGALVSSVTQQGVSLPAGGSLPVIAPFPIGTIIPATYTVSATLTNGSGTLATGQTQFNVIPDAASVAAVSIVQTDRPIYNATDQVQIQSQVRSQSANTLLSNLRLSVTVVDPGKNVVFSQDYAIAQLPPGMTKDFSVTQQLLNAQPGTYTVKQDLRDNQSTLLSHVETTYQVASSNSTGFGLKGMISASPKTVRPGENVALTASVTDMGNSALDKLPLRIYLVDPKHGRLVHEFDQTSSIKAGKSIPFNKNWHALGSVGTVYTAILVAQVSNGPLSYTRVNAQVNAQGGATAIKTQAFDAMANTGSGSNKTSIILAQDTFQVMDQSGVPMPVPINRMWIAILAGILLLLGARQAWGVEIRRANRE